MGVFAFITTGQDKVDRNVLGKTGEGLNSGRCENISTMCRHTDHRAIGANTSLKFWLGTSLIVYR